MLSARNDSAGDAFMETIIIERSTSPSFTSPTTIKINNSATGDARQKVAQTNGEVVQSFLFIDDGAKTATTWYYRFKFNVATNTIKVKNRASFMFLEAVNGVSASQ
jgi:hypothetical protein